MTTTTTTTTTTNKTIGYISEDDEYLLFGSDSSDTEDEPLFDFYIHSSDSEEEMKSKKIQKQKKRKREIDITPKSILKKTKYRYIELPMCRYVKFHICIM